ncbi:hypothetical protein FOL47_002841 [Perkinsus chesapeaki]|uniref:Uncharacterized protein n=1 Tax=Perkinsus chesapeaki TaxID=330153 RepID=A0A7J6MBI3_PERCH|nr:hypothetical protein FOL47_002841 [Perkinsus chesapeaki]
MTVIRLGLVGMIYALLGTTFSGCGGCCCGFCGDHTSSVHEQSVEYDDSSERSAALLHLARQLSPRRKERASTTPADDGTSTKLAPSSTTTPAQQKRLSNMLDMATTTTPRIPTTRPSTTTARRTTTPRTTTTTTTTRRTTSPTQPSTPPRMVDPSEPMSSSNRQPPSSNWANVSPMEQDPSGKKSCTIHSSDGSKITVYSEPAAGGSIYPKTTAQCKIGGVMRSVFQCLRGLKRIFGDNFHTYFFKMDCKEVFRNTGIQASSNDEGVAEMCRKLTS